MSTPKPQSLLKMKGKNQQMNKEPPKCSYINLSAGEGYK